MRRWPAPESALDQPAHRRYHLRARPLFQADDAVVFGGEVAEIVHTAARHAPDTQPQTPDRLPAYLAAGDHGKRPREALEQPIVFFGVDLTKDEVNLVIPPGERLQRGCEVPQHAGVTHREQNPHADL